MEVVMSEVNSQIEFIDLRFPKEEESRFFRIEMDVLRKLGYLSSEHIEAGYVRWSQYPFQNFFSQEQIQSIKKILGGYLLVFDN